MLVRVRVLAALIVVAAAISACTGGRAALPPGAGWPTTGTNGVALSHADLSGLVVHDGDRVVANGSLVHAAAGWELCGQLDGLLEGQPFPPTTCGHRPAARLVGRIDARQAGFEVVLHGRFWNQVIDVSDMRRDRGENVTGAGAPCPTPANTWRWPLGVPDIPQTYDRAQTVVMTEPDRYGGMYVSYAMHGRSPLGEGGGRGTSAVLAVATTIDVAAARREIAAVFPGPLRVYRVPFSATQLDHTVPVVRRIFGNDLYSAQPGGPSFDRVEVDVARITSSQAKAARSVRSRLVMTVHIRPAG